MKRREFLTKAVAGAIGAAALPFMPGLGSASQEPINSGHNSLEILSNRQKRYNQYTNLEPVYFATLNELATRVSHQLVSIYGHQNIMGPKPDQDLISHFKFHPHFSYSTGYWGSRHTIIRNLCIYGDQFLEVRKTKNLDADGLPHFRLVDMPVDEMYRIENIHGKLLEFQCVNKWDGPDYIALTGGGFTDKNRRRPAVRFKPTQMLHLRIPIPAFMHGYYPYGYSVINDLHSGKDVLKTDDYISQVALAVHSGLMGLIR